MFVPKYGRQLAPPPHQFPFGTSRTFSPVARRTFRAMASTCPGSQYEESVDLCNPRRAVQVG